MLAGCGGLTKEKPVIDNPGNQYINIENIFCGEAMDDSKQQREKLKFFVKTGIVVLSFLVFGMLGIKYIPKAVSVTNLSGINKLPIHSVDVKENKVALTFDVAGEEGMKDILEILALHNIKATFFMTGDWIEKHPEDVKIIAAAGHDLGNHSENHKHMSWLSLQECKEEILSVHNRVKEITGMDMSLFRAPYGDYNATLIDATRELGYYCIQWDVESMDWKDYGVKSIIDTVLNSKQLRNGSIIQCHSGSKYIEDALDGLILGLKEMGYRIVPVSQLIFTSDYYMDKTGRQMKKE